MATTSLERLKARLKPEQIDYCEWLVTPTDQRNPATKRGFAELAGVHYSTLVTWENDVRFRELWFKRTTEIGVTPDAIADVVAALKQAATDPDAKNQVQAANAYLAYAAKSTPVMTPASGDEVSTSDLTDDELEALIAESASTELALRSDG